MYTQHDLVCILPVVCTAAGTVVVYTFEASHTKNMCAVCTEMVGICFWYHGMSAHVYFFNNATRNTHSHPHTGADGVPVQIL